MKAMIIKALLAAVVVSGLTACASGPKYKEVEASIPPLAAGKGRIYFYRSGVIFGSGIQPSVMLNGQQVGDSKPGGFFFVDRDPGNYEVLLSTEVERKLTFTLAGGQEQYVKMTVTLGVIVYRVFPELVDAATAKADMQDLSYTGTEIKK
ncbi:MAG: DUF2846 domain-containing protein [Betaproteobacteria bacterium]|nr:DUF2846 domain-containing protein [Betaproteobacteria bacterium]